MKIEIIKYENHHPDLYFIGDSAYSIKNFGGGDFYNISAGVIISKKFIMRSYDLSCKYSNSLYDKLILLPEKELKSYIKSLESINKFNL